MDAHDQAEQETGFLTLIEEHLSCPFPANVVGELVEVTGFALDGGAPGIMAVCKRKGKRYRINVGSLDIGRSVTGIESIEAYNAWQTGDWVS